MPTLRQSKTHIGKRLETVADLAAVRLSGEKNPPRYAIDVGTDHAKLALYLIEKHDFSFVTATDINKGPCERARANVAAAGKEFCNKIEILQADGLSGRENTPCDRIIIAGMGGELIRNILRDAAFTRTERAKESIGFVLQPQSRPYLLRDYLFENGYRILDERLCEDGGKIYAIILAVYDGKVRSATQLERYFGKPNLMRSDALFRRIFEEKQTILRQNIADRKGHESEKFSELYRREEALFMEMEEFTKGGQ